MAKIVKVDVRIMRNFARSEKYEPVNIVWNLTLVAHGTRNSIIFEHNSERVKLNIKLYL